jgi:acetoin utilization deacetylase AcuC-like enzyme
MGFCLFNNVAVGAAQALSSGIERVAIVDFDVHYGNGTADIFRDHPGVLVCNTYQQPLYPFWPGAGTSTNLIDAPLPAYADGAAFRQAVESIWAPAVDAFRPQLILVSAGFDGHADDPLAQLSFEADDYAWAGRWIAARARAHADDRVVATLEGGYDGLALAASVEAFLTGLADR